MSNECIQRKKKGKDNHVCICVRVCVSKRVSTMSGFVSSPSREMSSAINTHLSSSLQSELALVKSTAFDPYT